MTDFCWKRTAETLSVAEFGSRRQSVDGAPPDVKTTADKMPMQTSLCCRKIQQRNPIAAGKPQTVHCAEQTVPIIASVSIRATTLALRAPHTHASCDLPALSRTGQSTFRKSAVKLSASFLACQRAHSLSPRVFLQFLA
jgi:hypothetical protein